MKVIFSLIVSLFANAAFAAKVLNCSEAKGGPSPASAVVTIEQNRKQQISVTIEYKNPTFPKGVIGNYIGQYNNSVQELRGSGSLGGAESRFYIEPSTEGRYHLVIYAGGDHGNRDIEFGFGAHLLCQ